MLTGGVHLGLKLKWVFPSWTECRLCRWSEVWGLAIIQDDPVSLGNVETDESSRSQKKISAAVSFNFSRNIYDVSLEAFKPPQNTAFTDDTHFSKSLRGDSLVGNQLFNLLNINFSYASGLPCASIMGGGREQTRVWTSYPVLAGSSALSLWV